MIDDKTFSRINTRMPAWTRIKIDPVEIDAHLIGAIITARHTVRIEHGYEFENKLSTEYASTRIVGTQDEVEKTVKDKRRWRLARMNSTSEHKHSFLVESKATFRI